MSKESGHWLQEYEATKSRADDILSLIQERNLKYPSGGQGASRMTATARRQLGALGSSIDSLYDMLESSSSVGLTENEKNRRRDILNALRVRRESMLQSLKRDQRSTNRAALLEDKEGGAQPGRETERTAELDNAGLLQLQNQLMREQDAELAELEKTVISTRHIALTVNEELDLHRGLLEDLGEDVDVVHSRMRAAQKRLNTIMKSSGNCKCTCLAALLTIVLVFVVLLGFKIISWIW